MVRVLFGLLLGVSTAFLAYHGSRPTDLPPPPAKMTAAERAARSKEEDARDQTNRLIVAASCVCGVAAAREVVIGLLDRFGEDRSEAFRRGIDNELGNLWRAMKKHWASRNTDKDVTDWLKSSARSW